MRRDHGKGHGGGEGCGVGGCGGPNHEGGTTGPDAERDVHPGHQH